MACNHDIAYLVRAYMQVAPRATPVQPARVYSNTQQIHARRKTRARFDPPIR